MTTDDNSGSGNGGGISGGQYEFFLEAIGGDMSVIKDNFDHLNRHCESLDIKISSLDLASSIAFRSYESKIDDAIKANKDLKVKYNILLGLNIFVVILLVLFKVITEI